MFLARSNLLVRHLRLLALKQQFSQSSSSGRRVLQVTLPAKRSAISLITNTSRLTGNSSITLLSKCHRTPSIVCKQHFHTTHRRFNPIIAIFARQAAKVVSIFLGRSLRKWWAGLPDNKRKVFLDFLKRHKWKLLSLAAALLTSFAYYYYSHIQETPITKRKRFIAFTLDQFEVLNKLEYEQQVETFKDKLMPTDHPQTQRVAKVVRQLLAGNKDIAHIEKHAWSVSVINDEHTMNAFVMPTGHIFVFSGLLKMVDNDDQLGIILAHEMSHAILGHGLENISHQHIVDIVFISLLGFLWMFLPSDLIAAVGTAISRFILGVSVMTPYSKMLEIEADEVGLLLAAKACFDVREASAFWHKMAIIGEQDPLHELHSTVEFLATHPSHEKRFEHIDTLLGDAIKCRQDAKCKALPKQDPRERVAKSREKILSQFKEKTTVEGVLKI